MDEDTEYAPSMGLNVERGIALALVVLWAVIAFFIGGPVLAMRAVLFFFIPARLHLASRGDGESTGLQSSRRLPLGGRCDPSGDEVDGLVHSPRSPRGLGDFLVDVQMTHTPPGEPLTAGS